MRFMILVKADKNTEAGVPPSQQLLTEMSTFNEQLVKAGVMVAAEGLQPSSKGARVHFSGRERIVTKGPFTETKGLICGYWIWKVKSREEAIEWVKRCPNPTGAQCEIEIRQVMDMCDFGDEMTPELRAKAMGLKSEMERPARTTMPMYGLPQHKAHYELIEDGKAGANIELPPLSFHATKDIPTLLIDAKGRRHMIALFLAGEHPNFRDYLIGSDDDPTVILAAKGLNGICDGFQAYQGPGGHMVVIMQTKTGDISDLGDTWVSMSDGTGWSKPICVTNNAGRHLWATTNTGAIGSVSHGTAYHPGVGAAAFDRQGHLILALVNGEVGSFGSAIGGVLIASGGTEKPMLFFYRL